MFKYVCMVCDQLVCFFPTLTDLRIFGGGIFCFGEVCGNRNLLPRELFAVPKTWKACKLQPVTRDQQDQQSTGRTLFSPEL